MISISQPWLDNKEKQAVMAVLDSGQLAQGPKTQELETKLAKLCETKYALAVNSGTAALHCALASLNLKSGDEVVTTPFTFIATANAILMAGAKPVFADIEYSSFNLDPKEVAKKITLRTKAILTVNLYGQPANYQELHLLAKKHHLKIIEDGAQSIGASYKNKFSGNLGDLGCFSFYATKNIMCGEGGAIVTSNKRYYETMKCFRHHGQNADKPYQYFGLGYNYRLTDLQAALALVQLDRLQGINKRRQQIALMYEKGLSKIPGLVTPLILPNRSHVFHQYTIRITENFPITRDQLKERLLQKGIGSGIYYPIPLHKARHFEARGENLKTAEQAAKEVLSLPVHPQLTNEQIEFVIKAIKKI